MYWEKPFITLLNETFPDLEGETVGRLLAFGNEVLKWNRTTNLISRKDSPATLIWLLADSLFLLKILAGNETFLDIGAGAGFPSIPILLASQTHGALAEKRQRRAAFLNHILRHLKIESAQVLHQAITPGHTSFPSQFDCLWSKAGLPAQTLFACGTAWVRQGGRLILFRPIHTEEENAFMRSLAEQYGFEHDKTHVFKIPSLGLIRTLPTFIKKS